MLFTTLNIHATQSDIITDPSGCTNYISFFQLGVYEGLFSLDSCPVGMYYDDVDNMCIFNNGCCSDTGPSDYGTGSGAYTCPNLYYWYEGSSGTLSLQNLNIFC